MVARVAAHPERLLAGLLTGNTLVNVASSSVAVALAKRVANQWSGEQLILLATLADTALLLALGEILPKSLAVQAPNAVARFNIWILAPLLRLLRPVARLLELFAHQILKLMGVAPSVGRGGFTRPELQLMFEDAEGQVVSASEGELASNIFDFFETRAFEIMTPRVDVRGIDVDSDPEEMREAVMATRHTRVPVYKESLDQVVGFVNAKEYLLDPALGRELIKPVHFVPERARLSVVLNEVKTKRLSLVVVVNEYGGTAGIITKEDLVEEIVGEIFDEQERDDAPEIEQVDGKTWQVDGLLSMEDLAEEIGIPFEPGPAQTVAGHIAHILGKPPRGSEEVTDAGVMYKVLSVARHRATRVEVRIP